MGKVPQKTLLPSERSLLLALVSKISKRSDIHMSDDKLSPLKKHPSGRSMGSTVHGNINHVHFGSGGSFERIVIYVCLTILGCVWLSV